MDQEFYREWFAAGLDALDEKSRSCLLGCCAKGEVIVPGKAYAIIFPECVCDLHATGGVNTPALCECSRQSIIYVGKQIWGPETAFTVKNQGTVLSGNRECRFTIEFR